MSDSDDPLKKHYKYKTVDGDAVIRDELERLTRRRDRAVDEELLPETTPTNSEAVSESLTGLALSGGGIRSGALGLGILQTLHRSGLLPFFDYLSTVSGGGYAGAYVTSAGSQNRKHADETSADSTSHEDTVPYGRLKAFHDGEGLSERMQQFIFGGHYLLKTRRFFNRHLMGLVAIRFMTITGLSTIAALAAFLIRELDRPVVRHFLGGLGFRTDISLGFFPVTVLLVLWLVCWCISFFRASGNMARAQGRAAAKLMPAIVVSFGICVASLLGNGEFSLEWLSSPNGVDIAGVFASAEKFFQLILYGVIGVGLLPFLNPAALIRSGARPKSSKDRVIFAVASRVLLYGLPFLLVSWFACENISSWTKHRFVPKAIRAAGLRDGDYGRFDKATNGATAASVNTDKSEISSTRIFYHDEKLNDFVALTRHEIAGWNDWKPAWAPFWTRLHADSKKKDEQDAVPPKTVQPKTVQRPRLSEFIWQELNNRIRVKEGQPYQKWQAINLPETPGLNGEAAPPSGPVTFVSVRDVLRQIHKESLDLQNLYARTDQNTKDYAPDSPRLILNRLLSLASFGPDYLQDAAGQNNLGQFVVRRKRLALLRNWLADHLSRILEMTNLGIACDWSGLPESKDQQALALLVEQASQMSGRHGDPATNSYETDSASSGKPIDPTEGLEKLSKAERRDLAMLNRSILGAAFPETLRDPLTVFAANVLEFDQARRFTMFWICLGFFLFGSLMININATTLHGFYARELANNWIQADEDADLPLSAVDATDQCLPYHILSGSVHWIGKRKKTAGDKQRDHFLMSPMYCGCEKTGFVSTSRYKDDELGLGDAIAISGGAVSPIQQGNPLLQTLLWLANLRLGQWLPNPSHGTFLPTKSRNLVERTPVTPMRLMWRLFQAAERRPFLFVTDGGHHENLGIGPLLKRRCRFILAVDAGEDADYAFSDLSLLMRWARVKHNVKLQPVDSQIAPVDSVSGGELAATVAGKTEANEGVRSAIDAWNDLAPPTEIRLSPNRLSSRHFVVLRIHYPDVEGPSWLVFAKTSLTGDEPAELIRYAESDKKFPHNPTSNQFYAPDTFEAYRQLGEHIADSMIGQLPSIIAGKMDEHEDRPEAPYLGAMLHQIDLAKKTSPLNITAAPPTPKAFDLIQQLRHGKGSSEVQHKLSKRLSIHPLFVSELLHAALLTKDRLSSALLAFLFPELGPETSPARQVFTERRLPGRAEAMRKFEPKDGHVLDRVLTENIIELAETLAVIPGETPDRKHAEQILEYDAVHQLLTKLRAHVQERELQDRINRLPSEAKNPPRKRKKTTRRRKSADKHPVD